MLVDVTQETLKKEKYTYLLCSWVYPNKNNSKETLVERYINSKGKSNNKKWNKSICARGSPKRLYKAYINVHLC